MQGSETRLSNAALSTNLKLIVNGEKLMSFSQPCEKTHEFFTVHDQADGQCA
jgi:hypothetical protein